MSNFFTDSVVTIKQESTENIMNTSASVPIPSRRDLNDYRTFSGGNSTISNSGITNLDFDNSQSPQYIDSNLLGQVPSPDNTISWSNHIVNSDEMLKSELIHMDDDDIFQVDKADLIQGPTLAELNANEEAYLGDLNFDDLLLPEENSYITLDKNLPMVQLNNSNNNNVNTQLMATSCPTHQNFFFYNRDLLELGSPSSGGSFKTTTPVPAFSPVSQASSNSSLVPTSTTSPLHINTSPSALQQRHSTLHELLLKRENYGSPDRATPMLEQTVGTQHPRQISRLSSSAPTHLGFEQIWQRREPRKHLLSTGSLAEAGSTSSISTGGILSPDPQDFSHDELESDDDSDAHYEDFSSDNGDSDDDDEHSSNNRHSSKKERFFWQYNVQAKGPKGQRLVMKCKMEDPHVLHEVTDPVFSPDCSVRGIKHSGKARKGDGNDLTPNAKKLYTIGKELDKLGRIINDMTPVSELPFNVRPTSRKEKNKLASRACRLKKKAQHEANKIKLNGLESEHKRLINGLIQAKQLLTAKLTEQQKEKQDELSANMDKIVKNCSKVKIAGHTTDYVNKILERLKNGAVTQQLGSSAGSDEQL